MKKKTSEKEKNPQISTFPLSYVRPFFPVADLLIFFSRKTVYQIIINKPINEI